MAVVNARVSVGTTATALVSAANASGDVSALLKHRTKTASVFLGGSGVTTANGTEWEVADGPLSAQVDRGEVLYGIVASGTQTVDVLQSGS